VPEFLEITFAYDELNHVTLKNFESPSQTNIAFTLELPRFRGR